MEKDRPDEAKPAETSDEKNIGGDKEIGGRNGPEPTRYGDWEKGGIAVDF